MKCPMCGSLKVVKNGKLCSGLQRFLCRNCSKPFTPQNYVAQPTVVVANRRAEQKIITPEDIEQELLHGIIINCRTSPQWAKLAIQVLEHIYPKFKDIGGKKFTPDDYKVFLEDMSKVDVTEIAKLALKEKNEPSE